MSGDDEQKTTLTYKGYQFVRESRLKNHDYAFRLNSATGKLYVSSDVYDDLQNDFEKAMQSIKVKDLSEVPANEVRNPVLKELKFDDSMESAVHKASGENPEHGFSIESLQSVRVIVEIEVPHMMIDVENKAPDFLDPEVDKLRMSVMLKDQHGQVIIATGEEYALHYLGYDIEAELREYNLNNQVISFELPLSAARHAWLGEVEFVLKSDYTRYLNYHTTEALYKLSITIPQERIPASAFSDDIMLKSDRRYTFNPMEEQFTYTKEEIKKCIRMLNQAIREINSDTGGTYTTFAIEDERTEELLVDLASEMGYVIDALDEEIRDDLPDEAKEATHMIAKFNRE